MVDQVGVVEPVKKVMGFAGEKYNAKKTIEDEKILAKVIDIDKQKHDAQV